MKEGRQNYTIGNMELGQLNFVLTLLGNRLDELEGRRGTPQFKSPIDAGDNRISNVGNPEAAKDALTNPLTTDEVAQGLYNLYYSDSQTSEFHDAIPGGHSLLKQAVDVIDAGASAVSVTSSDATSVTSADAGSVTSADASTVTSADAGAAYGAGEQALINEIKGDVNQHVTLINELKTDVNVIVTLVNEIKGDVTGGVTLINEMKGDINQLVTDTNAAITQLNELLANMRTAAQLV